jgi:hypothetical protein
MRLRRTPAIIALVLATLPIRALAEDPAVPVGDIVLVGTVERSGRLMTNDATLFEGDTLRTHGGSGGVLRLGRARVEIGESTALEIVNGQPLRIRVDFGSVAFSFPEGTPFEIVTPQLEVRPDPARGASSGQVIASPGVQDRVRGAEGLLYALERQEFGARRRIRAGEILVASLLTPATIPVASVLPVPQAAQPVAEFESLEGAVFLQRAATQLNATAQLGQPLFDGDTVTTQNGRADIRFTDDSLITMDVGTVVLIEESEQPGGGILRRLSQTAGSLWFNIQAVIGKQTDLETPTAVAAIRGTEGTQLVPNETQSTHGLDDGVQQITENITQTSVTLNAGEIVTAIRGVGFTPIAALLVAIPRPGVGGGAAGGGGAGAAGGAAGTAAGASTATVSSVASVATATAVAAGAAAATAVVATQAGDEPEVSDPSPPLSLPGGEQIAIRARSRQAASPSAPLR